MRRSIGQWRDRGVNAVDAELYSFQAHQRTKAGHAGGMDLYGNVARGFEDCRNERAHTVNGKQTGGILDHHGVGVVALDDFSRLPCIHLVVMHRTVRERQRCDAEAAMPLHDRYVASDVVSVDQSVMTPEHLDAASTPRPNPQIDEIVGKSRAESGDVAAAKSHSQRCVLHSGRPQALIAVPNRRIDQTDASHGALSGSMAKSACPRTTAVAFATSTCTTFPPTPAGIDWKSFITSSRQTGALAATCCPISTKGFAPGAGAR